MSEVPAGWYPYPQHVGFEIYWDGASWTGKSRPASAASSAAQANSAASRTGGPARHRAAWLVATLVPILVVLAIGGVLILSQPANAQAALSKALSATLAEHTADVTVSGSAKIGGEVAPLSGSGKFDLTRNNGTLSLSISAAGQKTNERFIYVNKATYLNAGPGLSEILPGKSWISLNPSQLSSAGGSGSKLGSGDLGTNNPGAVFGILGQGGNAVTALGASTINGITVQGYSVKVSAAAIRKRLDAAPKSLQQEEIAISARKVASTVFVRSSGTVYRLTTALALRVSGESIGETISLDFADFGAPVHLTAPPANQVGSYQNFVKALKALESRTVN